MVDRRYTLPNLTSLVAFEAVVRKGSHTGAGEELNVTKGAISQRMKALEAELGTTLLKRDKRGTVTTDQGAKLFSAVQQSFSMLSDEVGRIRQSARPDTITTQSSIAISTQWLTTKIAEFWSHRPDTHFDQIVSDTLFISPNADLIVAYGRLSEYPEGKAVHLSDDRIWPVASPEFAAKHGGPLEPEQLLTLPLIHMRAENYDWVSWQQWFGLAGLSSGELKGGVSVNNHVVALELARKGLGTALAWESLTVDAFASNDLVPLTREPVPSPLALLAIYGNSQKAKAREFVEWILANKVVG